MDNRRPLFDLDRVVPAQPARGTPQLDPFGNNRGNPLDPVMPTSYARKQELMHSYDNPAPVLFPRNFFAPEGARSVELFNFVLVPAGTTETIYEFTCPIGGTLAFLYYALVSTAEPGGIIWQPTIDGNRVLKYHGTPNANGSCTIQFTGGLDIVIPCQIIMEPGQVFAWAATNTTGADISVGALTRGYLDMQQRMTTTKFGD